MFMFDFSKMKCTIINKWGLGLRLVEYENGYQVLQVSCDGFFWDNLFIAGKKNILFKFQDLSLVGDLLYKEFQSYFDTCDYWSDIDSFDVPDCRCNPYPIEVSSFDDEFFENYLDGLSDSFNMFVDGDDGAFDRYMSDLDDFFGR